MASTDPTYDEKDAPLKAIAESYSSNVETAGSAPERTLHRQLKNRHIAMIRCTSFDRPLPFFVHMVSSEALVVS